MILRDSVKTPGGFQISIAYFTGFEQESSNLTWASFHKTYFYTLEADLRCTNALAAVVIRYLSHQIGLLHIFAQSVFGKTMFLYKKKMNRVMKMGD